MTVVIWLENGFKRPSGEGTLTFVKSNNVSNTKLKKLNC